MLRPENLKNLEKVETTKEERELENPVRLENPEKTYRFLLVPSSRKPLAKGLWSIFSLVIYGGGEKWR